MKKILVILPTYNEAKNIEKLFFLLKKISLKSSFLFIDHGSTDGTLEKIKKIKKKNSDKVYLIQKEKREGIGKAHKDGLKWAYKYNYDLAITMDTDLAHHPKYIKNLILKSKNFDVVVGSRYIKSKSMTNWSWFRVFLSNSAHYMTKLLFKLDHDTTNSFRCYNLKVIKKNFISLCKSNSYDFFYTSLVILNLKKYKITDIAMQIKGRVEGNSKMNLKHMFQSILNMFVLFLKIKFKKIK